MGAICEQSTWVSSIDNQSVSDKPPGRNQRTNRATAFALTCFLHDRQQMTARDALSYNRGT